MFWHSFRIRYIKRHPFSRHLFIYSKNEKTDSRISAKFTWNQLKITIIFIYPKLVPLYSDLETISFIFIDKQYFVCNILTRSTFISFFVDMLNSTIILNFRYFFRTISMGVDRMHICCEVVSLCLPALKSFTHIIIIL